jgi:hypothetical protein
MLVGDQDKCEDTASGPLLSQRLATKVHEAVHTHSIFCAALSQCCSWSFLYPGALALGTIGAKPFCSLGRVYRTLHLSPNDKSQVQLVQVPRSNEVVHLNTSLARSCYTAVRFSRLAGYGRCLLVMAIGQHPGCL